MAENHADVDPTNDEDVSLEEFDVAVDKEIEEAGDDPVKLKELIKARTETRQRLYARAKKAEAEAKTLKETNKEGDKGSSKADKEGKKAVEFDLGQEAYLIAKGVTDDVDIEFIKSTMKDTGKSMKEVLNSPYVQGELKAMREQRATEDATIKDGKRSNTGSRTSVDYWINKGELPPSDDPELRRKVVNEKIKRSQNKKKFAN